MNGLRQSSSSSSAVPFRLLLGGYMVLIVAVFLLFTRQQDSCNLMKDGSGEVLVVDQQHQITWTSAHGETVVSSPINSAEKAMSIIEALVFTENNAERHRVWGKHLKSSLQTFLDGVSSSSSRSVSKSGGEALGDEHDVHDLVRPENPTEKDYLAWYEKQVEYCGPLCSFDPSKYQKFEVNAANLKQAMLTTPIKCMHFFTKRAEHLYDGAPLQWPPPTKMVLQDKYALGATPVYPYYLLNRYMGTEALTPKWTKELIDGQMSQLKSGNLHISYGGTAINNVHAFIRKLDIVAGKSVMVLGTENPWVEEICLLLGASKVTTVEYGKIISEYPKLYTVTPPEINEQYRQGKFELFDIAITFSSIEHSGLGRYGDMLSPWGDVIWMAKLSCMVKQGGKIVVGVPWRFDQPPGDSVYWNAHRVYGSLRWPLLLQNWEPFDSVYEPSTQHMIVAAVNKRK